MPVEKSVAQISATCGSRFNVSKPVPAPQSNARHVGENGIAFSIALAMLRAVATRPGLLSHSAAR